MSPSPKATSKLTDKQKLVWDVLVAAKAPLSAYALLDELREDGFRAPPQVYRALEKLRKVGLVHRLESVNAFVACQHTGCEASNPHTVLFAICEKCGNVQEESDPTLTSTLFALSKRANFALNQSVIELKGHCEDCQKN